MYFLNILYFDKIHSTAVRLLRNQNDVPVWISKASYKGNHHFIVLLPYVKRLACPCAVNQSFPHSLDIAVLILHKLWLYTSVIHIFSATAYNCLTEAEFGISVTAISHLGTGIPDSQK